MILFKFQAQICALNVLLEHNTIQKLVLVFVEKDYISVLMGIVSLVLFHLSIARKENSILLRMDVYLVPMVVLNVSVLRDVQLAQKKDLFPLELTVLLNVVMDFLLGVNNVMMET